MNLKNLPSSFLRRSAILASLAFALSPAAPIAQGANNTFNGTGTTWNAGGNWTSGATPASTDALLINGGSLTSGTVLTLDNSYSAQTLSFDTGGSNNSINANSAGTTAQTLTLSGGTDALGNVDSIDLSPTTTGGVYIGTGTGTGAITISLSSTDAINVSNAAALLDINGVIAGSSGLTKTGSGSLTLGGPSQNSYTGNTNINGGLLTFDFSQYAPNFAGSYTHVIIGGGGAITIAASGTLGLAGVNNFADAYFMDGNSFSGAGTILKTGAGYIRLATSATALSGFTGTINVQAGTLGQNLGGTLGSGTESLNIASGAAYDIRIGNLAIDQLTGLGTFESTSANGNLSVGNNNGSSTFSGVIQNGVSLTKNGTGTLDLNSSSQYSYTGNTNINGGLLEYDFSNYAANNGSFTHVVIGGPVVSIAASGTLGLNGVNNFADAYYMDSNSFSGAGTILKTGTGYIRFVSSATALSSFTGTINVQAGTLGQNGANENPTSATLNIASGAAYDLRTGNLAIDSFTGLGTFESTSGNGNLSVGNNNGSSTFAGVVQNGVSFTKNGTGTEILTGANTYSGATVINSGTLQIGNGGTTGAIGSGGISGSSGATLVFNENSSTLSIGAAISGSMGVIQAGTGETTLYGANTFTGSTLVNSGTLRYLRPGTSTSVATVNAGGTLLLDTNGNTAYTTYSPATILNGGTLAYFSSADIYEILGGTVTNQAGSSSSITTQSGGSTISGLFADNGLFGSGTVTINALSNGAGFVLRNNSSNFTGTINVNGAASTSYLVGSGLAAGGCTTGLQNADINVNGTLDLGAGIAQDWANAAVGTFQMGALSGTGVMIANRTSGGTMAVTLGSTGNSGTFSGIVANGANDTLSLVKTGTGSQFLTGANTYTGSTTITAGTFQIGGAGVLGGGNYAGAISISSSAALVYQSSASQTLSGSITGAGPLTQSGFGTLTLTAADGYTGPTTVSSGTLALAGASGVITSSTSVTIASGATLALSGGNNKLGIGTGAWIINGTLSVTDATADTLYSTSITLNGGTMTSSTATPTFGAFYMGSNRTITVNGSGNTISAVNFGIQAGQTLTLNTPLATDSLTASSIFMDVSGSGLLAKSGSGTLTLTGASTYTGATTINAGTLQIGNGGTTGSIASTSISGSAGATLAYDLSSPGTVAANTISGGLGLTQAGSGSLKLTGNNGYTGPTNVTGGTLIVAGHLSGTPVNVVGGTLAGGSVGGSTTITGNVVVGTGSGATSSSLLAPSAGGGVAAATILTINGNLTLNSDAAFVFSLDSSNSNFTDAMVVNGTLTLAGAVLTGSDISSGLSSSNIGNVYPIASATTITGTFSNAPLSGSTLQIGNDIYTINYGSTEIDLTLTAVPEPATWAMLLCGTALLLGIRRRRLIRQK